MDNVSKLYYDIIGDYKRGYRLVNSKSQTNGSGTIPGHYRHRPHKIPILTPLQLPKEIPEGGNLCCRISEKQKTLRRTYGAEVDTCSNSFRN